MAGLAVLTSVTTAHMAHAQSVSYNITPAEKAACTADATRLCFNTYPDEQKLLGCMEANKTSLTKSCFVVFNAGLKRRHLVVR